MRIDYKYLRRVMQDAMKCNYTVGSFETTGHIKMQDESQMDKIALIEANDTGINVMFAISENC